MSYKNLDESTIDLIISAAYDDASWTDKIKVSKLIKKNSEAKKIYDEYRSTALEVNSLKEECPDHLINQVNLKIGNNKEEERSFSADLYLLLFKKPAITFTAVAIIVLTVLVSVFIKREQSETIYSRHQVEMAKRDAKAALFLVSSIFNQTEDKVTNEILKEEIGDPLNRSLKMINNIIYKGELR